MKSISKLSWNLKAVFTTFRLLVPSWARLIQSANERLIQNEILTALSVVCNLFFHVMLDCWPDPFNCISSSITIGYWIACSIVDWTHLSHDHGLTSYLPPFTSSRLNFSPRTGRAPTPGTSMSAGMPANFLFNRYKGKAVPLQACSGPDCSRKLRFPNFMTTPQDGGKVVS